MHEKIRDIQNAFWKAYKDYANTFDKCKYENDVIKIENKYRENTLLFSFCQNMAVSWVPIINSLIPDR